MTHRSWPGTPAQWWLVTVKIVAKARRCGSDCREALSRDLNGRVTLDGDGQHAPEDLPVFLDCAEQTGARLVIGNRMHNARAIPWLRRQVNGWMSRKLSRLAGRHLPDTQCGFRLIHLETWSALPLKTEHFEVESEMLMAFLAARCQVEFVPIQVIRSRRRSRIRPVTDSLRWWKWWRKTWTGPFASNACPGKTPAPAHLVGFQTYFPLALMYPNLPPALTRARPFTKGSASSNCGLITNFPVGSMNPQCFA